MKDMKITLSPEAMLYAKKSDPSAEKVTDGFTCISMLGYAACIAKQGSDEEKEIVKEFCRHADEQGPTIAWAAYGDAMGYAPKGSLLKTIAKERHDEVFSELTRPSKPLACSNDTKPQP